MNRVTDKLTSLALEKTFLGGLFKNSQVIYETETFLKESDFINILNQTIFTVCRGLILEGNELNKTLVAQKVKDLNISFKDPMSPFDYIDAITMAPATAKSTVNTAKELVKLRIRRDLYQDAQDVQTYVVSPKCSNQTVSGIISEVDSIYNKRITAITTEEEPVDLFAGIEKLITSIAKNPNTEVGLKTPFKEFNGMFGGLRSKNGIYNIISRSGEGKSCFLFNMAKGVALLNNCPVLYLDTEMSLDLNMFRAAAAEAGVNAWYLETGMWSKNTDLVKKVQRSFKEFNKYEGKVFHKTCPNAPITEVLGLIRKWYFKHVGRGNKCMVVYDYIKITNDLNKNRAEWQQLGDKVSFLNEIGHQFDIHIWSAGQQNRSAQISNSKSGQMQRNDDSTTAGASDRINQYACFNGTFRQKTLEEITEHGVKWGTHLLNPFKVSRTQGKDNYYNNNKVRVVDQKNNKIAYRPNFINYNISNYQIEERGTYKQLIEDIDHHKDLGNGDTQDVSF